MDKLTLIEQELSFLGLLDKAREIYNELGSNGALSYIRSSYHLLSKIYHPELNPGNEEKARELQQRLNIIIDLISQTTDDDIISLLKKDLHKKNGRKKKILVVEDESSLQEIFRDVLIMEGYDVRIAVDGENGYQNFLSFEPDLVFTDIIMPKMSGIELVKKIREINPDIKVIYISGFFGLKNIKRDLTTDILKYGYPYLSKPFKITAMLELVDKYISGRTIEDIHA
ncbi:MAG: putative transcriptional regulatory protein TcrX [Smithella sp. PtaU1.Bin162]|nr:MAG: putative transcriptional regulatory protein TcrX [Smithella sp. PtaU1.Bin162]